MPGRLHAPALADLRPGLPGPDREHPPGAPARLSRARRATAGVRARRQGERGHRPPRGRGPRLRADRGPGSGARSSPATRPSRSPRAFSRSSTGSIPRAVRLLLEGRFRVEGRRVIVEERVNPQDAFATLTRGAVDVVTADALKAKLARGPAAHGQGRLRSDRARHPPRPHRRDPEDAALPGPRAPRHLPDRRLHRDDRRPDRARRRRARRSRARRSSATPRPTRSRSSRSSTRRRPRSASTASGSAALGAEGIIRLAAKYTVARMLERDDFRKRFEARPADRDPRVPLPAGAGLRLGRAARRTSSWAAPTSSSTSSSGATSCRATASSRRWS